MPSLARRGLAAWSFVLAAMIAAGCSQQPVLLVDVRTDLVPHVEFASVRTELVDVGRFATLAALFGDDFQSPHRVAELSGVPTGSHTLRVSLLDADGTEVVSRPVQLTFTSTVVITVVLTRSCRGVSCGARACQAGLCVDPGCSSLTPALCTASCTSAADCAPGAACSTAQCVDGACFVAGRPDACGPGQWCDPLVGCAPLPSDTADSGVRGDASMADAGVADAGGADSAAPDSGSVDPTGDAGTAACAGMADGTPCGAATFDAWGPCGGFASTCDTTGTQSRTTTSYACMAGVCVATMGTETGACSRTTDGTTCGTTSYGFWSTCTGFANVCDTSGMQNRSVTTHTCSAGSCTSHNTTEYQSCSRSTNGVHCGRPACPDACSGGTCQINCGTGCPC